MPRGKTKTITTKSRKKAVSKPAQVKTTKTKTETVLGSQMESRQDLGVKIPVQELKTEAAPQFAAFEDQDQMLESAQQNADSLNSDFEDYNDSQDDYQNQDEEQQYFYPQKDLSPRAKNLIMYISIFSIMGVLVVFWGLNIKNSLGQGVPGSFDPLAGGTAMINQFQTELNQIQISLNTNAPTNQAPANNNPDIQKVSQQILDAKIKNDISNQLKQKLENLNANVNVSITTGNTNIANNNAGK